MKVSITEQGVVLFHPETSDYPDDAVQDGFTATSPTPDTMTVLSWEVE